MTLADKVVGGDVLSIARAMSWIENDHEDKERLIDSLYPHCGNAVVWGITGPPGSGKSTLLDLLIAKKRQLGKKMGVVAVDPTSAFSGGAILGDRLRMQNHSLDEGVFIRSMATRGHLGGVAGATADAIKVLDAAGFDLIVVETIGVGQAEIEVVDISDIVLLVLVPGLGDEIQALKAGVMEIGDVFIINKSDKEESSKLRAEVDYVLGMRYADNPENRNPIVLTSATRNEGIDELIQAIDEYQDKITSNGRLEDRRKRRVMIQIERIIAAKIQKELDSYFKIDQQMDKWVDDVAKGKRGPYSMINEKLEEFLRGQKRQ